MTNPRNLDGVQDEVAQMRIDIRAMLDEIERLNGLLRMSPDEARAAEAFQPCSAHGCMNPATFFENYGWACPVHTP